MLKFSSFIAILLTITISALAGKDYLVLESGEELMVDIIDQTPKSVTFKVDGQARTVTKDEIRKVELAIDGDRFYQASLRITNRERKKFILEKSVRFFPNDVSNRLALGQIDLALSQYESLRSVLSPLQDPLAKLLLNHADLREIGGTRPASNVLSTRIKMKGAEASPYVELLTSWADAELGKYRSSMTRLERISRLQKGAPLQTVFTEYACIDNIADYRKTLSSLEILSRDLDRDKLAPFHENLSRYYRGPEIGPGAKIENYRFQPKYQLRALHGVFVFGSFFLIGAAAGSAFSWIDALQLSQKSSLPVPEVRSAVISISAGGAGILLAGETIFDPLALFPWKFPSRFHPHLLEILPPSFGPSEIFLAAFSGFLGLSATFLTDLVVSAGYYGYYRTTYERLGPNDLASAFDNNALGMEQFGKMAQSRAIILACFAGASLITWVLSRLNYKVSRGGITIFPYWRSGQWGLSWASGF